jgi:polyhydroxybutyrate depolymerase
VLHGYTGTPERIEQTSGWTPFAEQQAAVVAYPEGTAVGAGGFGWNTGTGRFSTAGVDDAAYLAAVVDHLVATACVDPARILLTGESNGGAMTVIAACHPTTRARFASFAPVIPAIDQRVLDRCGGGPPVAFTALAGRLDRVIPYDGVYPAGQLPLLAQETWFVRLAAQRNGCPAGEPTRERIDGAELIRPAGCPQTPTLVAIDDGTHTWPGGPDGTGTLDPGRFPATVFLWGSFVGR